MGWTQLVDYGRLSVRGVDLDIRRTNGAKAECRRTPQDRLRLYLIGQCDMKMYRSRHDGHVWIIIQSSSIGWLIRVVF